MKEKKVAAEIKKIASTRSHEVYLLLQRDIPSYAKFDRFLLAIQFINVIN